MKTTIENHSIHQVYYKQVGNEVGALKCLALALVFLTSSTHAAVYYVDSSAGNDSNNGTSQSAAWAHIPAAVGFSGSGWVTIQDGDTILVKGGSTHNYQVQFTSPGYSSTSAYNGAAKFNSILIQSGHLASPAWGSGQAIIDGQNTRTYGLAFGQGSGASLYGITFDGFEIRNIAAGGPGQMWGSTTGSSCILLGGNNPVQYITIKRCWLHDAMRSGDDTGHGIEFNGAQYFIVTQNKIGPKIGTKGIEPFGSSFGVISSNYFCGTGDHCIALTRASNVDVCNNIIYNLPPQVHDLTYSIAIPVSQNCDIWNNLIYRNSPVNSTGYAWSEGIGMYSNSGQLNGNRIVFNTVAFFGDFVEHNVCTAIVLSDYPSGTVNVGTVFQNNLVYRNFNRDGNMQYFVVPSLTSGDKVTFNSFFGQSTSENVMSSYSGGYTYSSVAGFSPGSGHTYANNVQLDPKLSGGAVPDGMDASWHPNSSYFQLTANSPATITTTGNAISGDSTHGFDHSAGKFSRDIVGRTRTLWSMGAYEAGTVSVQPPLAPTGLRVVSAP